MISQLPAVALLAPLAAGLIACLAQWLGRASAARTAWAAAGAGLAASLAASLMLVMQTLEQGQVRYWMGGWAPPWGIELVVDSFGAMVLALIPLAALANLPAAARIAGRAAPEKPGVFCALYLLCAAGHMGVVAAGDMFNLYVLIEITALSGYALLSMGSKRAPLSAFNYLLIGSVGASLYLLGVGYVYIMTGTLNMADIARVLKMLPLSGSVLAAFAIILAGLMTKMALFPLHAWMPNAYAHASPASAGLLAPLTTKVMVYVLIRLLLNVFGPEFSHIKASFTLAAVGVAAAS